MRWIVTSRMRQALTDEVFALFPAERARATELFQSGLLEQLYVSADYMQAWLICKGESEAAVEEAVASLPLARFSERQIAALLELA